MALSGFVLPTNVEFAADGRVFVAEKSGIIKVYDSLLDPAPTSFSGLTTNVLDLWDRGLLGMTLDPSLKNPSLPLRPWVYVLYTYDHILGSAAAPPRWGDACPTPPGPTTDGCVASGRLSRFSVNGSTITGPEQVLVEDWCQQFTSHSMAALRFGPDGALYVSAGDGADFNREDWGQWGGTLGSPPTTPKNPCGDPPNDAMVPPTAEGGALRAQDVRTSSVASGTYVQNVMQDSPLAYWRLGETSGTLADDAIGTNNGTYTGGFTLNQSGALVGDPNTAVLLNGSTGYVRVPQLSLPGSITLEAWANPTTYPGDTALAGQWNGTSGAMLYATSDFGGRIYMWVNGSAIFAAASPTGAWHHYVGTYDGTNAALYIDGGLAAGPAPLAGPLTTAPRFFEIGTYNDGGGAKFNGRIDEVAVYPTALSASRIQAHFVAGRQPADPTTLDGTILRVDPVTGAAFAGNPYASSPDLNKRRIIAYGLRNPFRFDVRPGTNELWLGDVGWQTWEEINRVANTGDATVENFGWPCYEGVGRQPGYDSTNLTICEGLYAEGAGAVTAPVYTYNHSGNVVPGETCPTGGSAISGMTFYPESGGTFPSQYRGGLFFADHARSCIWWIAKGTNGQPDPSTRAVFLAPAASPVDLDIGFDGSLYYVDIGGGAVRQVSYSANNQPPTAVAQANPSSGPVPLTVNFSGTASTDPEGGLLTYAWDLDGDGAFDDSTSPTPAWTYSSQATVTVGLRVTDPGILSDTDTVVISAGNTPPVPVINTPTVGTTWAVGQQILFSGSATDQQDGAIPANRLSWQLTMQHCPSTCHAHEIQAFPGVASGSFNTPDHEYPSYLDLTLTATDSNGVAASTTRRLDPRTVNLSLQTVPAGLQLSVNGVVSTTPFSRTVIESSTNSLTATTPQTQGAQTYVFDNWSDGGAASHGIVASSSASYTATFTQSVGSTYVQNVMQDSPLAYWRLGETSGTLADDAIGTRDGTYTGGFTLNQSGALVGDSNTSVLLNGSTGYVRAPQISLPGSITLEAWGNPTTYPGDTALAGQWNGTSGAMLYATSDFGGRIYMWVNGSAIFAAAPSTGAWHHYVGTYDGTNAAIYIDGGLAAGPTPLAGPLTTAPRFFEIGTYNDGNGRKFNGKVDEVAIYPTALSASRIQAHFAAASGP